MPGQVTGANREYGGPLMRPANLPAAIAKRRIGSPHLVWPGSTRPSAAMTIKLGLNRLNESQRPSSIRSG
jgi:hypothetical protein